MTKRTSAIKKSDKNKAWNKNPNPSKYRKDTIPKNKTILIVCEGQTEKVYFESFPVVSAKVQAEDLKGQSKLKLVDRTKSIVENSEYKYDEIWCVFDMDLHHGEKEFTDFDNAIKKAYQSGYHVAYSNDSFELWFYLHYKYNEAENLRYYYYDQLSEKWGINYGKKGKTYNFCQKIYNRLKTDADSNQQLAIKRAKRLFDLKNDLAYHKQNPTTTVYLLVEELNNNLRK